MLTKKYILYRKLCSLVSLQFEVGMIWRDNLSIVCVDLWSAIPSGGISGSSPQGWTDWKKNVVLCRAVGIEKSFGVIPPKSPKSIGWFGHVLHELAMCFLFSEAHSSDVWASSKDQRHWTGGSHYHHPNLYENMSQRHKARPAGQITHSFLAKTKTQIDSIATPK